MLFLLCFAGGLSELEGGEGGGGGGFGYGALVFVHVKLCCLFVVVCAVEKREAVRGCLCLVGGDSRLICAALVPYVDKRSGYVFEISFYLIHSLRYDITQNFK